MFRRLLAGLLCLFALVAPVVAVVKTHVLAHHHPARAVGRAASRVVTALPAPAVSPGPVALHDRVVLVGPNAIDLVQGPTVVRSIPFAGGTTVGFESVVAAVADPGWLAVDGPGVFAVRAAVVQSPSTDLTFAAPAVREVRLVGLPEVYLAGDQAHARFDGVTVTSWDPAAGRPVLTPEAGRPFVLYQNGSRVDVANSEMAYLGSDRAPAVGVAWTKRSSGTVTDSRFDHNAVGAYVSLSDHFIMQRNTFESNAKDGLQVREGSTAALLDGNEASGNGGDGILVTGASTGSTVSGNHVHDNAGDGIAVRLRSDNAKLTGNQADHNGVNGLTTSGSGGTSVTGNRSLANHVGINATDGSSAAVVQANQVAGNLVGIAIGDETTGTVVSANTVQGPGKLGILIAGPGTSVAGGSVSGATLGVDVRVSAVIDSLSLTQVSRGIAVRHSAVLDGRSLDVVADSIGIAFEPGGMANVAGSNVRAIVPLSGGKLARHTGTSLSSTRRVAPLTIFGAAVLLVAVLVELIRRVRERHDPPVAPAPPASIPGRRSAEPRDLPDLGHDVDVVRA
ncbi:MAG: mannuronan 5-epimerase [Actinomycetota bacterium]|jgi:parallel beta-helix repeat protein|nr:mannuronan 5-epimerase [Actinomycetota bacterium]